MKHSLTILALSAVTLLMSQCGFREQEAPEPSGGRPFALIAAHGETKTVNDGLSTRWEMDDPVSVFHAPAGTASYIRDGLFKIDIPATGHAVGTVQELSTGLYDWYLFYPGNPENGSTPGGSVTLEGTLTQSGYGSKAHLAGPGFPLGGKAGKVAFDAVPSVTLRPLASVIRVHVTNAQATPSRIKEVSFTAPEAVSGAFQVRWDGVFTASGNVSPAIRTQVEGGALLSTGETADVYLGLKPFQAAAGAVLTLSVVMEDGNGNQSYQERTLTLSSPVSFQGGLIKTLNFSFDGEFPAAKEYRFRKADSVKNGHHYLMVAAHNGLFYAGLSFADGVSTGRMEVRTVTPVEDVITLSDTDGAFKFAEAENGWVITQSDGRFLFNNNADNIGVSDAPTAAGKGWTIEFNADGAASIANRTRQFKFNTTSSVMKFQTRLKTASGVLPVLYELLDDDMIADEFAAKQQFGFYSFDGVDYCYTEGEYQLSVRTGTQGFAFRLLHPSDYSVVQATPIPSGATVGDCFDVDVKRFVKLTASFAATVQMEVIKVEDDKIWLLSEDGSGIIAKTR